MTEQFLSFLHSLRLEESTIRQLYILGDLFEVWLGDDLSLSEHDEIIAALRETTKSNVQIFIQHGNRDFLLGKQFEQATGAKLIPDFYLLEQNEKRILLMHGDLLCIDDRNYQQLRKIEHNSFAHWIYFHLPKATRRKIGKLIRGNSERVKGQREYADMDVNLDEVIRQIKKWDVDVLIHGHIHQPARYALEIGGKKRERIVLADWDQPESELLVLKI